MKIEIPGQLRGPECRAVITSAITIRKELEPIFENVKVKGCSKLSLILRVGGSLGEFALEAGDGLARREGGTLVCDILIKNHDWANRTAEEIGGILASHLTPAISECCRNLNLSDDVLTQALSNLPNQSLKRTG